MKEIKYPDKSGIWLSELEGMENVVTSRVKTDSSTPDFSEKNLIICRIVAD